MRGIFPIIEGIDFDILKGEFINKNTRFINQRLIRILLSQLPILILALFEEFLRDLALICYFGFTKNFISGRFSSRIKKLVSYFPDLRLVESYRR